MRGGALIGYFMCVGIYFIQDSTLRYCGGFSGGFSGGTGALAQATPLGYRSVGGKTTVSEGVSDGLLAGSCGGGESPRPLKKMEWGGRLV